MMASLDSTVGTVNLFGDATRVRLMALLANEELTVAEITAVMELSQSRVSTHLGRLKEAGLLRDRRVGASTFYTAHLTTAPADARRVWQLLDAELDDPLIEADRRRCEALRQAKASEAWPDSVAGEMERHYSPGRTWEATARGLLGFLQLGEALDIGSGDGVIAQLLAPRARSITCLDRSEKMIEAARRRLAMHPNASFVVGDMHELPFGAECFDDVLLFNVLTSAHGPERVVSEAARVLRRGSTLAIVTLHEHEHQSVTAAYQHLQPGFSVERLRQMLERAGLVARFCEVTSRERKTPYFEVITAFADKANS
jgi:ArsR family transcriptional regulator